MECVIREVDADTDADAWMCVCMYVAALCIMHVREA